MQAIVVGVDGLLGRALAAELSRQGHQVFGTTRRRGRVTADKVGFLDLAVGPWRVEAKNAEVAFICAAMTNIAECRRAPEQARRVNVDGPVNLGRAFVADGITPVLLSTNAVFDCREPLMSADRPKRPSTLYGELKSQAEDAILGLSSRAAVVRLTKVLTKSELLAGWWRSLNANRQIEAASDHRIAPIGREHAVTSLIAISSRGSGGIYQLSASSDVSYVELASRMADRAGKRRHLVVARDAAELGIPPNEVMHYTSLDARRSSELTGIAAPEPSVAINLTIDELASGRSGATP